ncbi:MAG: NADH:flavin oxidoreductase/NADH oxidase [Bacteroidia bacterium]|nr:NADH:flavin oxidoreductase/NADH oxidase [Bacteroidia bacterium]
MNPLFQPLKLRGLSLKNRIAVSPMQQYSSEDGFANDWHLVHLGSRAVGGAGLIISECAVISPEGLLTKKDIGIWKDAHIEKWEQINYFIHQQGAKSIMQIGHFGAKGSRMTPMEGFKFLSPEQGGWATISSSAHAPFRGMAQPTKMDHDDIKEVIKKFGDATERALSAGFDSVEIHAAHGYLIHQYYSQLMNRRDDEYGGSLENRLRFLKEVIREIRSRMPDAMPLFLRISAVDFSDDPLAWTLDDSVALAKMAKAEGVDLITASGGGFVYVDKALASPGYQVPFAERIRNEAGIATGAVGMINEGSQANSIIANGQADLAVMAREFLRNPYFPINAAREIGEDIAIPGPYTRAY